jgi:hypothetical protein
LFFNPSLQLTLAHDVRPLVFDVSVADLGGEGRHVLLDRIADREPFCRLISIDREILRDVAGSDLAADDEADLGGDVLAVPAFYMCR